MGAQGSSEDGEAWARQTISIDDHLLSLSVNTGERGGEKHHTEADTQTLADSIFLTSASRAPKDVDSSYKFFHSNLKYHHDNLDMAFRFYRHWDRNIGIAFTEAIMDEDDKTNATAYEYNIAYSNDDLVNNWDINAYLNYGRLENTANNDHEILPPGALAGTFPNGVILTLSTDEEYYETQISGTYRGFDDHLLSLGAGGSIHTVTDVHHTRNFSIIGGFIVNLGATMDFSSDIAAAFSEERNNTYIFLQDEWSLIPDWELTYGARYDNYSGFGDIVSPRIALVWAAKHDLNMKLLYGEAFRPPTYLELHAPNEGLGVSGNKNLQPQTNKTYQLATEYRSLNNFLGVASLFHYEIENVITTQAVTPLTVQFVNSGTEQGDGIQLEGQWRFDNYQINANATRMRTKNLNGNDPGHSPRLFGYIGVSWDFAPEYVLSTDLHYVADRRRAENDARQDISDYTLVDLKLMKTIGKNAELSIIVKNIFDEDAKEPSLSPGLNIPNDLPVEGRRGFIEFNYKL